MVMNLLAGQGFVRGQGGFQYVAVLLNIVGYKIKLAVCFHQLLSKLSVNEAVHVL
jgi:hypothetical protein